MCVTEKLEFSRLNAVAERDARLAREEVVLDNNLVELVAEVISALGTAVSVINSKKGASWPVFANLAFWLYYV